MVTPVTVAFIGSGPRAASQLEAMRRSGTAEPVAFWNRTPEVARRLADATPGTRAFDGIAEMVRATTPDVVAVSTHPASRIEPIREAVDAGAMVILLEKPIALSAEDLDELSSFVEGSGCFVAVNTQYPWMDHWRDFRELLAEGGLGTVRAIRASTGRNILEQGPHLLSLALSTAAAAGLPAPSWVLAGASGDEAFGDLVVPAELTAAIDLGAARLLLLAGESAPRVPGETELNYQQQIEITGDKGLIWVSLNQGWTMWRDGEYSTGRTAWPDDDYQSQADLFRDLAAAVHDPALRAVFPTRLEVSAAQCALLFACIESARTGRRVGLAR
ncbi:MAG: Gfo/Idh/MocA family oxidoreductase [Protaetiibacter sp.]